MNNSGTMLRENNSIFFDILQKYKVLLKKSQLPKVKEAKEKALSSVQKEYLLKFGQEITIDKLKRKILNMRSDVKKKVNGSATGNKSTPLKDWEREVLQLMKEEESNSVFIKIPGAKDVNFNVKSEKKSLGGLGLKTPKPKKKKIIDETQVAKKHNKKQKILPNDAGAKIAKVGAKTAKKNFNLVLKTPKLNKKKITVAAEVAKKRTKKQTYFSDETEETKNLNNQELKRLVLLKQLKLLNLDISEREKRKKNSK